jgi:5'(3')-deoxyribonucleotidase
MSDRTVMIDFDDCLVDFTQSFLDRANKWIKRNYYIRDDSPIKSLTKDDIFDYDYRIDFIKYYTDNKLGSGEIARIDCEELLKRCFSDVTFYDNIMWCSEAKQIFDMIQLYKDKGYKIILNTKVNSLTMVSSKVNFMERTLLPVNFDEIIFDVEYGIGHSEKPIHYDVMIDDSPKNIINYLNKNETGIVYMPVRKWNSYLLMKGIDRLKPLTYETRCSVI